MICYTVRMIYFYLYDDWASDYVCSYLGRALVALIPPLAWEIVPNVTIMYWHHENFKTVNFRDRIRPLLCCCACLRGSEDQGFDKVKTNELWKSTNNSSFDQISA